LNSSLAPSKPLLLSLSHSRPFHSTAVTTFNTRVIFSAMATLLMLLVSPAKAGFGASCIQSWTKSEKKIEGTYSNLSTCQQSKLDLKANNNLLGGTGSAEIITIPILSGGEGCKSGSDCMKQCQALCCITKGCIYASIKKEEKTTNVWGGSSYLGYYQETEKKFYCRMYQSGKLKNSESQSTCYPPSNKPTYNCYTIASEGFGWNKTTYESLVDIQDNNSCPVSGRRLLMKKKAPVPSKKQINNAIKKVFKPFAKLKKNLKKASGTQQCDRLQAVADKATSIYDSNCFDING
jgi:hypothetical protein